MSGRLLHFALICCVLAGCGGGGGGGGDAPVPVIQATPGGDRREGTATLSWQRSSSPRASGHRVYWGVAPGTYIQPRGAGAAIGAVEECLVVGLESGVTYYFAVTAIDAQGFESAFSNEASKSIP